MSRSSTDRASELTADRPDGRPGAAAVLSRSTLMMLRRVLHAYREGWVLDDRLAAAARMVAEDARQGGLAAERMLVALKRAWAGLDDVRRLCVVGAGELLARLVTLCIRAYYAPQEPQCRRGPTSDAARHGHVDARTAA